MLKQIVANTPTGCATGQCSTDRKSQLNLELIELGNSIDRLEKALSELHGALSPVLRVEPLSNQKEANAPEDPLVDRASAVRLHRRTIERLTADVAEMTRLSEV